VYLVPERQDGGLLLGIEVLPLVFQMMEGWRWSKTRHCCVKTRQGGIVVGEGGCKLCQRPVRVTYCDITWSVTQAFRKSFLSPATCSAASNDFPHLPMSSAVFQCFPIPSDDFYMFWLFHSAPDTFWVSQHSSVWLWNDFCMFPYVSLIILCSSSHVPHSPSFRTCSRWNIQWATKLFECLVHLHYFLNNLRNTKAKYLNLFLYQSPISCL